MYIEIITSFITEHRLIILLGIGAVFTFVWSYHFRQRLQMNMLTALILAILHTVYGVLCVKTFAVIESFGDPASIGSMSLFGGVFFMPIGYYLGAKITHRKIADVFDIYTPCMIFTLLCARVNCIFGGCCMGRYISGTSGMRWPTRESEIIFYIILLIIFGRKISKNMVHGDIYPLYMICYGIFRSINECFRISDKYPGIFHVSHIWAIITLTVGVSIYSELRKKSSDQLIKKKRGEKKW